MKIHIVQRGDTLWTIAEKHQVSFEEVKKLNAHLADPDMIVPGMKIKLPDTAVEPCPDKEPLSVMPVPEDMNVEMPENWLTEPAPMLSPDQMGMMPPYYMMPMLYPLPYMMPGMPNHHHTPCRCPYCQR